MSNKTKDNGKEIVRKQDRDGQFIPGKKSGDDAARRPVHDSDPQKETQSTGPRKN